MAKANQGEAEVPGEKKGRKEDKTQKQETKMKVGTLYIAAALGAFFLSFSDLFRNDTAATTLKIAEVLRRYFLPQFESGAAVALVFIVICSILLCWINQPQTRVDAFARGLSVFAILTVATPYDTPSTDSTADQKQAPAESTEDLDESSTTFGSLLREVFSTTAYADTADPRLVRVEIFLDLPRGFQDSELTSTLRKFDTAEIVTRQKTRGSRIPIAQTEGTYTLEIEAPGLRRTKAVIHLGNSDYKRYRRIEIAPSKVPLAIQRLLAPESVELSKPLRSTPRTISQEEVESMVKLRGFDLPKLGLEGTFENSFELAGAEEEMVIDHSTSLMWQRSGTASAVTWLGVKKYLEELNSEQFGGYSDWRVPTIEELLSLVDGSQEGKLLTDPLFDDRLAECWTADSPTGIGPRWKVQLAKRGAPQNEYFSYFRAVRDYEEDS